MWHQRTSDRRADVLRARPSRRTSALRSRTQPLETRRPIRPGSLVPWIATCAATDPVGAVARERVQAESAAGRRAEVGAVDLSRTCSRRKKRLRRVGERHAYGHPHALLLPPLSYTCRRRARGRRRSRSRGRASAIGPPRHPTDRAAEARAHAISLPVSECSSTRRLRVSTYVPVRDAAEPRFFQDRPCAGRRAPARSSVRRCSPAASCTSQAAAASSSASALAASARSKTMSSAPFHSTCSPERPQLVDALDDGQEVVAGELADDRANSVPP